MKKIITLSLAAAYLSIASATAQNGSSFYQTPYKERNSGSFDKGTTLLSAGYGFPNLGGSTLGAWGSRVGFGPLYLKYEKGIMNEVGVGGHVAIGMTRWGNGNLGLSFSVGALGYYHFNKFIPVEKLDVYAGVGIGMRHVQYRNAIASNETIPLGLGKVGARYYFSDSFSAFLESGYDGMSSINLGVTIRK